MSVITSEGGEVVCVTVDDESESDRSNGLEIAARDESEGGDEVIGVVSDVSATPTTDSNDSDDEDEGGIATTDDGPPSHSPYPSGIDVLVWLNGTLIETTWVDVDAPRSELDPNRVSLETPDTEVVRRTLNRDGENEVIVELPGYAYLLDEAELVEENFWAEDEMPLCLTLTFEGNLDVMAEPIPRNKINE